LIVIWRARALSDLSRIVDRIVEENPFAARRVARDLVTAGNSLASFARRARLGHIPNTRELILMRPYVIVFEINEDRVEILLIWHASRTVPNTS